MVGLGSAPGHRITASTVATASTVVTEKSAAQVGDPLLAGYGSQALDLRFAAGGMRSNRLRCIAR